VSCAARRTLGSVPMVKCIRNHKRYERISEPTAAGHLVAVNREEIDSLSRCENSRDLLGMYIAIRLRDMGCGGIQNTYKKRDSGYIGPIWVIKPCGGSIESESRCGII
jgi:hypothetical protein